jgi:hypothetical protein
MGNLAQKYYDHGPGTDSCLVHTPMSGQKREDVKTISTPSNVRRHGSGAPAPAKLACLLEGWLSVEFKSPFAPGYALQYRFL